MIGLKFKMKPVAQLKRAIGHTRVTNKLVECYCTSENGVFKAHVELDDGARLVLDFTPDSYNLYNREIVFDKTPDIKWGRGIYVRREREYKYSPGSYNRYITLCENCTFNGYVVRDNKTQKLMFKMNKFVKRGNGRIYDDDV